MISTRILTFGFTVVAMMASGQTRNLTFNGKQLSGDQEKRLSALERIYNVRLPDQAYWYDNRSGAMGLWNGPAAAVLPPGLQFGGPMPANCSRGGTGVFVNGRELHPLDVASLSALGPVFPGRYWLDSNGDFGFEGMPRAGNLIALASARGGNGQHRVYGPGELSGVVVNSAGACTSSGCAYPSR